MEHKVVNDVPKVEIVQDTLATEMIREIRATSKRWFIAFIVTLSLWFATIIGFILYEYYSLPVEDTVTVENEDGNANYIGNDMNGDLYNGESNEKD